MICTFSFGEDSQTPPSSCPLTVSWDFSGDPSPDSIIWPDEWVLMDFSILDEFHLFPRCNQNLGGF